MGHGRSRQRGIGPEGAWAQHGWGGPPPWLAGLFGMGQPEQRRGPRVRRGDVRSAILDVLREAAEREEPINGYQVIQQIADKSNGAWRPSPGSVYPTIQQLQDEGLVEEDQERGRRTLKLTGTGATYVHENADQLDAVWVPFERRERAERESGSDFSDLKPEIGQVMGAVWQILTQGSDQQRAAAVDILVDTRRRLYGVLADGTDPEADETGDE